MLGRSKPTCSINITPYIDILLVLLIIFMVIQPNSRYDLEARVPHKPAPHQSQTGSELIVVSIDTIGNLTINSEPCGLHELGARLFEIYRGRANKNLFVRGAPDLPFGTVIAVIDIAKGVGVGDVGLILG